MKNLILLLAITMTLGIGSAFKPVGNPDKFVQFYVPSLENREKAMELNELLKSKDGVKMSRVDATGKVCYVIFTSEFNYTETDVEKWLTEKGYSHTCFHSGIFGEDAFKKLTPEDCATK